MTEPSPRRESRPPRRIELSTPRRAALGAALGAVVALLLLPVRSLDFVEGLELQLVDVRTRHYVGDRAPDPRIVLAEILEPDVKAVKRDLKQAWPWPLEINAGIFDLMAKAKVLAVLVDMEHLDRGAGPDDVPGQAEESIEERQAQEGEMAGAEAYAGAMKAIGRVALALDLAENAEYEVPARVAVAKDRLGPPGLVPPPGALRRGGAQLPVRRVAEGATVLAFVNVPKDVDGGVRRSAVVGRWGDRPVLGLPLATAWLASGGDLRLEADAVTVGGVRQRLMPDGSFLVNFRGPPLATYAHVFPSKILEWARDVQGGKPLPAEAREALEGKIVVWGRNLSGETDFVASPLDAAQHGPEFQATALDDLLHGDGRVRASPATNALVLFALTIAVAAAGVASRRRFAPHATALVAAVAVTVLAFAVFARGTSLDLLTPVAGIALAWGGALAAHLLTEGRYNRWLEGTFGRYLAPEVIDALKKNPSMLALGGVRRHITVLFSDVAGFTTLSESLAPEKVVTLLNEYLTKHCDAVFAQGGVVDKFLGDGVMAFFGDPVPSTDHAVRACRAALAVQGALPSLRPVWESMGLRDFPVRVGLNSGDALVGNMGSRQRFDYTCMGDTVNLASRLEGANKAFGTRILLGPLTYQAARDHVVAKPLAEVGVVGREQPVAVYELMAMRADAPPALVAHVEAFSRARDAAKAGDLEAAARALDEADRSKPNDGPVAWFRGVLDRMRSGKEPSTWSGVYVLSSK